MKSLLVLLISGVITSGTIAQSLSTEYEPSSSHPFGTPNPQAPAQIADFEPMIGLCDCKSVQRNGDGTWQDTLNMQWKFKYIMNGTAIQDEVWRDNDMYAGSIRQYHVDSAKWVVSYFSYPSVSTSPGIWMGSRKENEIVLYMDQKAPNGMEGKSRLTFYAWDDTGYKWKGEWITPDAMVVYPFWTIECTRRM